MALNSFRTAAIVMSFVLMSAVVSAQGEAPGVRPDPGMPSNQVPAALSKVSFEQRLNQQLPLDLQFKDESGRTVKLGEYFGRKPVVLTFVYYDCPMLCTQVLNGLESALRVLNESIGKEFDVVTVSFDPKETPVLASGKKKAYLERYKRSEAERGWHFLTGDQASIEALTKAAGFNYSWDEASHQFAHPSGIVVATPAGKLSRYFFGIDYSPRDLKFALIESSNERIGTLADQLLLYCYHYDPATGKYGAIVNNILKVGAGLTILILGGLLLILFRMEKALPPVRNMGPAGTK
jgi:protein SCO1